MPKIRLFTLPNLVTLLNLLCGCMATFLAFRGDLQFAFAALVLAAVFDFLDGFAARLLHSCSEVGRQLDSLCDVISFGMAPSAILLELIQSAGGGYWGLASFLLAAFSALRLAKFNVDASQSSEFRGLPTPAAGLLVGSIGLMITTGEWSQVRPWMLLALLGLVCVLLVCNLRMFSLKFRSWGWRENGWRYGFLTGSAVLFGVLRLEGIPYIMGGYILASALRSLICPNHGRDQSPK